jgi:rubredoxin
MDPTNSVLDVEDDFSEIEKMYMSDGLSNMSKFITSASNHVTLLTGDTDASIINPKDTLRQKLHFMDFKYLLIAKALSTGENVLPVDVTCPSCMKSYNLDLNVKQCLALFPEELQKSHDEYDGGKTYKELTENWRVPETSNVITKLEKPILDEFTSKYFDKVMYTLNFIEPSIDKYMKIKEAAIALLTFVFKEDMTPDMMRNEVSLLTTLYNRHPVRVARLQSIMESFTILESITISYFDTRSGADVLVTTDEITIEEYLDVVKLYDLITVYLPTDVLGAAREYLMNRYKLDEIRQKLADRAQEPVEEIPMPTLLDEMTQISMENLTCPECGHVHAAEASVLFLGFSLVEKLMQKIRV